MTDHLDALIPGKPSDSSVTYAEKYLTEDEVIAAARARAAEVGITPISPGGGAGLRFLASILDARAVVEVGTGTGVSGLWLLRGMRADGILTTVDRESEHLRLARETFNQAEVPTQRARTIAGDALDVLTRLTDGHYDIVVCDGDAAENHAYLAEAKRLLRPGGVVAFVGTLNEGKTADPAERDATTQSYRALLTDLKKHDDLVPLLLPIGDGLLLAKKEWLPE